MLNINNICNSTIHSYGYFREWRPDNGYHRVGVIVVESIKNDSQNVRVALRFAFYKTTKNNHHRSLLAKAIKDINSDTHSVVVDKNISFNHLIDAYNIQHMFANYMIGFCAPENLNRHNKVVQGAINEIFPRHNYLPQENCAVNC